MHNGENYHCVKKRWASGLLAVALAGSLATPAFAAGVGEGQETPITVTAEAAIFNVSVPTVIALAANANAEVICPTGDAVKITNQSPAPIKVTQIAMNDGAWTLADYNGGDRSKLAAEKVDSNKLGLALTANGNTAATSTTGNQTPTIDSSKWSVSGAGSGASELPISVDAIASAVSATISAAQTAAKVIFTMAWDTDGNSTPSTPDLPADAPTMAASSTWYKSSTGRDTITKISFVDNYTPTGSESDSWNADVGNTGAIKCYIAGTELIIAGNGAGKIYTNPDASYMFSLQSASDAFYSVSSINGLNLLDTSNTTNMDSMFWTCPKVESLDVSHFDTENVTTMDYMFAATGITSINLSNFNTKNVTKMEGMFRWCENLTSVDLSSFNTQNVTTMEAMFNTCHSLQDVNLKSFNTAKTTTFKEMFFDCRGLTTLDLSNFDTSKATDMSYMFSQCYALQNIDVSSFNTANVTNMSYMFDQLYAIKTIDLSSFNTANVKEVHRMFAFCLELTTVYVSDGWTSIDASSAVDNSPKLKGNVDGYFTYKA